MVILGLESFVNKRQLLWQLGLVLMSLGILFIGLWSLSAAIYASHWAYWSSEGVQTAFGYCAAVFLWPTVILFFSGLVLLLMAFRNSPSQ
jgi:hypothetical protein